MVECLAAKGQDMSLGIGGDQKRSKKKTEYWTYIHHVATNMTPNESLCSFVAAG